MSMYEETPPAGAEPDMPPPGAPPAEPGAPPPPEVPEYGEGEGMAASSWWESMADLRLCGKKVTNEQAKAIFTLMGALIVALVVVVIVSATGGGGGDGGSQRRAARLGGLGGAAQCCTLGHAATFVGRRRYSTGSQVPVANATTLELFII